MKKILVIRFSSIGDMVLTTPVLRALKQQLGAEVHVLTKHAFRSIVEANPYVDRVWAIQKQVGEVVPALRGVHFDAVVDLHRNLRSWQVRRILKQVPAYVYNKLNIEKWLMVQFKWNRLPQVHIVDRYMASVAPLGVVADGKGLDYFIPEHQEVDLGDLVDTLGVRGALRDQLLQGGYIALVIGAAHATKRMPVEKIRAICKKLTVPVLLLGGPADRERGEEVVLEGGSHVFNACGRYSLDQSASIVRQAWKVITHDTGLMHIAAAFGKEIISVWGNTIPAFGMWPYDPEGGSRNTTVEVSGLSCRPCSKIGFERCPKGHFKCMQEIDVDLIGGLAMEKIELPGLK